MGSSLSESDGACDAWMPFPSCSSTLLLWDNCGVVIDQSCLVETLVALGSGCASWTGHAMGVVS